MYCLQAAFVFFCYNNNIEELMETGKKNYILFNQFTKIQYYENCIILILMNKVDIFSFFQTEVTKNYGGKCSIHGVRDDNTIIQMNCQLANLPIPIHAEYYLVVQPMLNHSSKATTSISLFFILEIFLGFNVSYWRKIC